MIPPIRWHLREQSTKLGKHYHASYMRLQRQTKMQRFSWWSGTSKMGFGAWIAQRENKTGSPYFTADGMGRIPTIFLCSHQNISGCGHGLYRNPINLLSPHKFVKHYRRPRIWGTPRIAKEQQWVHVYVGGLCRQLHELNNPSITGTNQIRCHSSNDWHTWRLPTGQ